MALRQKHPELTDTVLTRIVRTSVHVAMIDFIPCRYIDGKRPYILFYQTNPFDGSRERHRLSFNLGRISPEERAARALDVCKVINAKLPHGYPYDRELYEANISMEAKAAVLHSLTLCRDLRKATMDSYNSITGKFIRYLTEKKLDTLPIGAISTTIAELYAARLIESGISARTFNGDIDSLQGLFTKLKKKKLIFHNIWEDIDRRKVDEKTREPIPTEYISIILDYLRKKDITVYTSCLLQFYCMIRPNEQRYLKRSNFDLERSLVYIHGASAKNRKSAVITLPDEFRSILIDVGIEAVHSDDYLLRNCDHLGSGRPNPIGKNMLGDRYRKAIRFLHHEKILKRITGNTLYSWKDVGNDHLSDHVNNALKWMNQNRHSSLDETQKYLSKRRIADPDIKANHKLPL